MGENVASLYQPFIKKTKRAIQATAISTPQNALAKEYLNMSNSAHILDCHIKPAWLDFRQIIVLGQAYEKV